MELRENIVRVPKNKRNLVNNCVVLTRYLEKVQDETKTLEDEVEDLKKENAKLKETPAPEPSPDLVTTEKEDLYIQELVKRSPEELIEESASISESALAAVDVNEKLKQKRDELEEENFQLRKPGRS